MRFPGHRARRTADPLRERNSSAVQLPVLRSLLEIATCAVTLQPAAEEVIRNCGQPGGVPGHVARRAGRIAADYFRLHGWAVDLIDDADRASLQFRVAELVHYHARMVDLCLTLAFPKFASAKLDQRRQSLEGLGESARTLREARAALALWIAELECEA
jgi:hypothetical protein